MNESEQAQAIKEIKRRHIERMNDMTQDLFDIHDGLEAHRDVRPLLRIVDSQAQKITDLESKVAGYELALDVEIKETEKQGRETLFLNNLITEATISLDGKKDTIADQAKEIDRLKA